MEGPKNYYASTMNLFKKENFKNYLLYILFGFGGIWHVLNMFQNAMRTLSSPLIIAVSLLMVYDVLKSLSNPSKTRFLLWCFFILSCGWGIEGMGVYTHFPFGNYHYGNTLKPQILQIPIAIGFAWLTISLSSLMMTLRIIHRYQIKNSYHIYIIPILTAVFMLIFDLVMENAAPKLDYWIWHNNVIPLQNYLLWFLLGSLFSWLWFKLNISMNFYPTFGIHVYLSQFIYFMLVIFKDHPRIT